MHPPLSLPPAVVVHGLPHARAAMAAAVAKGRPLLLLSAPGAALFAGAAWWRAMVAASLCGGPAVPDALDCADQPGRALEALACGCRIVILAPCPAFAAVVERAAGAQVLDARPPALDLADRGAPRRLIRWLEGDSGARFG